MHRPHGKQHSGNAAQNRKQNTFGEQLTDEPGTAGAERQPNSDFALARSGACQQQVGDVHHGDEQHKTYSAQQHPKHGSYPAHEYFF